MRVLTPENIAIGTLRIILLDRLYHDPVVLGTCIEICDHREARYKALFESE